MILKVVSWNIWFGTHYHKIAEYLKNAEADVIALQEVIEDLDGKHNTAENLAKELGYHWRYEETMQVEYEGKTVSWGNAILSKYPILDTKLHEIILGNDRRTALETTIEIEGKDVTVISTHLLHTHQKPSEHQEAHAKKLLEVMPDTRALVMGDFNALPDSNAVKIMNEKLVNVDSQLDPTWSMYIEGCEVCKVDQLVHRLDYMFATKDVHVHSYQTDYSKGSDHLPIAATVEFN